MRRCLSLIAAICCVPCGGSALAAPSKETAGGHAPGTSVEMPYLIAPIEIDGKLVSYAYVSSRIDASSPATAIEVRDRLPFIQDAYVRDVNAAPIGDGNDPPNIDRKALAARFLADARRIVGPSKVAAIEIIQIQISILRPSPRGQ
jgi:hypothetical protein